MIQQQLNYSNENMKLQKGFFGLNCLYANVDQLLNKMDDHRMLISTNKPDIMLFTEVIPKAQKHPILETQVKIQGYEIYTNFNHTDTNLGASGIRGVAICVRDNIKCNEIKLKCKYADQVWVEISLRNNDKLLCGCIYRSPNKEKASIIETTTRVCEIIVEAMQRNNSHLLICGDFNYPLIDWENEYVDESSNIIKPFLDTIQDCHLHQHIFQPTRHRKDNESSLLDLVLSNEEGMVFNLTHNSGLGDSDHECINFTLNCYEDVNDMVKKLNFFKADYVTIRDRLSQINWIPELEGDFSTAYVNFSNVLEEAMEGCTPEYNVSKKKSIYMTAEAIRKKNLKNKLWRRYKSTRCDYDRMRYIRVKNDLRSLTRRLRFQFENNMALNIKASPKKIWSYVKSKTKTRNKIPALKKKDGTEAVTASEKADTLNKFVSSTFTDENLYVPSATCHS